MSLTCTIPARENFWKPERPPFKNRVEAGELLGKKVVETYGKEVVKSAVVFGLVRGGVPLAGAVAKEIHGKVTLENLNVIVCRKVPRPDNKEFAIGSISEDGTVKLNEGVDAENPEIKDTIASVQVELKNRIQLFRNGQPFPNLAGKTVIIVDDGLASGRTMRAAVDTVRHLSGGIFQRLIVAVPISSLKAKNFILEATGLAEEDFCVHTIAQIPVGRFWDIEDFYENFQSVKKEEVRAIMQGRQ